MPKRLLIIEDEISIQKLYQRVFTAPEYECEYANEGHQGFRKASTKDFDLVITDIRMPGWNGLDAIRSTSILKPYLRFIVVSAYVGETEIEKALKTEGAVIDAIQKPFQLEAMRATIDRHLARLEEEKNRRAGK